MGVVKGWKWVFERRKWAFTEKIERRVVVIKGEGLLLKVDRKLLGWVGENKERIWGFEKEKCQLFIKGFWVEEIIGRKGKIWVNLRDRVLLIKREVRRRKADFGIKDDEPLLRNWAARIIDKGFKKDNRRQRQINRDV